MNRSELEGLLNDITRARVAVIGDYCLDAYWFMDPAASEISIETGLPTRPVQRQRYTLGGAGNVVMNLLALKVSRIWAFGVIGDDPYGQHMLRLLQDRQVDVSGMLMQRDGWDTHVYTKPYVGDREENRVDFGNFNRLADGVAEALVGRLEAALASVEVVIVNEQVASGIHQSRRLQECLAGLIRKRADVRFLLDSRHCSDRYEGALRKLNDHEAARLCGIERPANELVLRSEAVQAAESLWNRWQRPVFVTRGARGCLVHDAGGCREVHGLQILGRVDTVGAGDSMLAGIAAALAAGHDHLAAATLGNFVAGVTVQKLFQTGTASPEEVLAIGAEADYVYRPELAEDLRQARYAGDTEIEIVCDPPRGVRFTHVILDHDGTLSTLRQGWEQIMEPMMIRAVLGDRFADADESQYQKVVQSVREFIDKTTGIQTLAQMEGLVRLVREFGFVAPERVLDAAGYKAAYTGELSRLVARRIAKLQRGELAVEDYVLKNAVPFLQALCRAGVTMYLASGTDEADVVAEATALGYAGLFEGRIYGAVGRSDVDAKRVVLDRILTAVGAANARNLLAVGDGPVEIRETHKRGGYCVGIASDEIRRFGINPGKRARLVRAGADLIVPDFSQLPALLKMLGITA